jgi:anti-anti-sigma factor
MSQMQMTQEELQGGVLKVVLVGSLDIPGSARVDLPLSVIAGSRRKVIIDFTQVDFLASIGVRTIVKVARTVGNRGGRVVLVNPNQAARKVLASTGVDTIVTIVDDQGAAQAVFG